MTELVNETKYCIKEMISVAQRENNSKRPFLLANKKQAKHIPSNPSETMALFHQLGKKVEQLYKNEKVIVIGFAETATAIGTVIASHFEGRCIYIQTTREPFDMRYSVVHFEEEHSHASLQSLYCQNAQTAFEWADRIIFAEDEITTGKTILNFVNVLKEEGYLNRGKKLTVASLLNCMKGEDESRFHKKQIDFVFLVKITNRFDSICFQQYSKIENKKDTPSLSIKYRESKGRLEPRKGIVVEEYLIGCQTFCQDIFKILTAEEINGKKILLLGTEEFMYPAICLGERIENEFKPKEVFVHATTRSPIVPHLLEGYAVKNRSQMESIYEKGRKTFVYNLKQYDKVLIMTDAPQINEKGMYDLLSALSAWGNKDNITVIRWVEK